MKSLERQAQTRVPELPATGGYRTNDEERIGLNTVAHDQTGMAEFAGMKNLDVNGPTGLA